MIRVNRFIETSDLATLKNDAGGTLSLTLPNSITIPAASTASFSSDLTIGKELAQISAMMRVSSDNRWVPTRRLGFLFSDPNSMAVLADIVRISATTFRLLVTTINPYNYAYTIQNTGVTITAKISTFMNPLAS